jgi:glycosyltransferase involved in cell wall biosynthesis
MNPTTKKESISCIIPAYNEGKRIRPVLEMLSAHPLISEILVVDDGSRDDTAEIVRTFASIRLIVHETNKGKTEALYTGITSAAHNLLLLVDADLIGLTAENITDLIAPVADKRVDVSISMRKNSPLIDRLLGIDQISGERVFYKQLLEGYIDELLKLPPFGFETFFNEIIIKKQVHIAVIFWKNVISPYPSQKYGFISGSIAFIKMIQDILHVVPISGVIRQYIQLRRLKRMRA